MASQVHKDVMLQENVQTGDTASQSVTSGFMYIQFDEWLEQKEKNAAEQFKGAVKLKKTQMDSFKDMVKGMQEQFTNFLEASESKMTSFLSTPLAQSTPVANKFDPCRSPSPLQRKDKKGSQEHDTPRRPDTKQKSRPTNDNETASPFGYCPFDAELRGIKQRESSRPVTFWNDEGVRQGNTSDAVGNRNDFMSDSSVSQIFSEENNSMQPRVKMITNFSQDSLDEKLTKMELVFLRDQRKRLDKIEQLGSSTVKTKGNCLNCNNSGDFAKKCPNRSRSPSPTPSMSPSEKSINWTRTPNRGRALGVSVKINNVEALAVVDNGADATVVPEDMANTAGIIKDTSKRAHLLNTNSNLEVSAFEGVTATTQMGNKSYDWSIFIAPIKDPILLEIDFMKETGTTIQTGQGNIGIDGEMVIGTITNGSKEPEACSVIREVNDITVPASSERLAIQSVLEPAPGEQSALEVNTLSCDIQVGSSFANVNSKDFPRLLNVIDQDITIKRDFVFGKLTGADEQLSEPSTLVTGKKDANKGNKDASFVYRWDEVTVNPDQSDVRNQSAVVRNYYLTLNQFKFLKGVLHYSNDGNDRSLRLVVPKSMRKEVIKFGHEPPYSVRQEKKTVDGMENGFHWYGLSTDATHHVANCRVGLQEPLLFDRFPESASGNSYILVIVDLFTKLTMAYAMPNVWRYVTANSLEKDFIACVAAPFEIHTDQGSNLQGSLSKEVCALLQVTRPRTTTWHPDDPGSIGRVGQLNRVFLQMILCYVNSDQKHWDEKLPLVLAAYRSTPHLNTGYTPSISILEREVHLSQELSFKDPIEPSSYAEIPTEPSNYVGRLQEGIQEAYRDVCKVFPASQIRKKKLYDHRDCLSSSEDPMYMRLNLTDGPFCVAKQLPPVRNQTEQMVVHYNLLKSYHSEDFPGLVNHMRQEVTSDSRGFEEEPTNDDEFGVEEGSEDTQLPLMNYCSSGPPRTRSHIPNSREPPKTRSGRNVVNEDKQLPLMNDGNSGPPRTRSHIPNTREPPQTRSGRTVKPPKN